MTRPLLHFLVRVPLYTVLGLFALAINPFGINEKADQASQDAFYRVIAPLYESTARDEIVVVLLNDRSIEELYQTRTIGANEWPLLYSDHGLILERIASYKPRALFVDIYFKKERSTDPSLTRMLQRVQRSNERYGTRFLFAGGYSDEQWSPIQQRLNNHAVLTVNGWQGYGSAYPLRDVGHSTVAYDLYRIACLVDKPLAACQQPPAAVTDEGMALSVRWGSKPAPAVFPEFLAEQCEEDQGTVVELLKETLWGLVNGLQGSNESGKRRVRCPYHSILFAEDIMHVHKQGSAEQRQRLAEALQEKVVLYAVDLEGLHDIVVSPVHGRLPGVMMNAMALDNLMTYGAGFTRASDEVMERLNYGAWFLVVLILSGVLYWLERRDQEQQLAGDVPQERFVHSRKLVYLVGVVTVASLSLIMFVVLNYEPMNSLGYLGIGVFVGELVHSNTSGKLIAWAERYRDCVRQKGEPGAWLCCLRINNKKEGW